MSYANSFIFSMLFAFISIKVVNYFFYKRKVYASKNAKEWMSFGISVLFLNLIPLLTKGDMTNRSGDKVDPLAYFYFSLPVFLVSVWISAFQERKERNKES